jgi:MFS transporter, putative metabolite:H+ symporter
MNMTEAVIAIDAMQAAARETARTDAKFRTARSDAISARLDRSSVTRVQALLIAVCALGLAMDSMEMSMGGAFSAIFSTPPNAVTPRALSWLLSAVYIGAISGAPVGGWMGDKYGRRISMIVVLVALTVTSIIAAFTPGFDSLVLSRVLSGIAFGAFPPLMIAYLAEFLPSHRRGMFVLVVSGLSLLGPPAGIFLIHALNPIRPLGLDSWRWALLLGGTCSAVAAWLAVRVPESPRWLASRGRLAEAEAACDRIERSPVVCRLKPLTVAASVASRPRQDLGFPSNASTPLSLRRMALVAALFFLSPWSIVAFPLLSGALLIEKGIRLSDTLFYLGLSTLGPVLGTVVAAFGIDRLDRRWALGLCALGMFGAGAVFNVANQPVWLVASSFTLLLCASLYIPTINVYASELFPPAVRARAVSRAWTMNRVGAAAAPIVLLPILATGGPTLLFGVIGLALGMSVLILFFSPKLNE